MASKQPASVTVIIAAPLGPLLEGVKLGATLQDIGAGELGWSAFSQLIRWLGLDTHPPAAPACAAYGLGFDQADRYWMWADPIHIQIGRDHGRVALGSDLQMSDELKTAVAKLVSPIMASRGGRLVTGGHPQRWMFEAPRPLAVITASAAGLSGQDFYSHRPQGPDSQWLRALMLEIEMELNSALPGQLGDASAQVNGVWLSEGGCAASATDAPLPQLFADGLVARGLWRALGCAFKPLSQWSHETAGDSVLYIDSDSNPLICAPRQRQVKEGILLPLLRSANRGHIRHLRLLGTDGLAADLRSRRWRLWQSRLFGRHS